METNFIISGAKGNETNAGFIRELVLIDVTQVAYLVDPAMGGDNAYPTTIRSEGVGVSENAGLYKMNFNTKTCSFSETQNTIPEGQIFLLNISWDFPKNRTEVLNFFWTHKHKRWLAIFRDSNNVCYLAGDIDNGLFLSMNRSINAQNMITMQLAGRFWHPTWFMENMYVAFADSEFSKEFNFDFKS